MKQKKSNRLAEAQANTIATQRTALAPVPKKGLEIKANKVAETKTKPTVFTEEEKRDLTCYAAIDPSTNGAIVAHAFQGNLHGIDATDSNGIYGHIALFNDLVSQGKLGVLEEMLVGQAVALQTIFVSLAKRASDDNRFGHYQTFLQLAFKAQAQSRATVQALVELKYPRQVAFVKQANIANGPQQINNGQPAEALAHAKDLTSQTKLLELEHEQRLEPNAAQTTGAANSQMEAVGAVHRPAKPGRQGEGSQKRIQRRGTRSAT